MAGRVRYRLDEAVSAYRAGGAGTASDALAARVKSDVHGLARRAYAHAKARRGVVALPIQGSVMELRLDDPGLSRALIRDGIREREHTQLIHEEIRPGMVGVDLGANLGYYALLEARLVGPSGRVIAVEPVPANAEVLRRNVCLNAYAQVDVHEVAISDECGSADMRVTQRTNYCNLLDSGDTAVREDIRESHASPSAGELIEVPALTLDAFLDGLGAGPIDFIRMDIEGHEIRATQGMRQTLASAHDGMLVFVEVHNAHFQDPAATVGPWMRGLLELGFRPKALAVPGHAQGILRDLPRESFPELLCSFADRCPHVLLIKGPVQIGRRPSG